MNVSNPLRATYEQFPDQDGLMIWLKQHPFPLRIEFTNGVVSKTWPQIEVIPSSPPEMQKVETELARLQSTVVPGMTRKEVYDRLAGFDTPFPLTAENFIPGYQEFRVKGIPNPWTDEFKALLLRTNTWQFQGLKELLWYKPYYSTVTLYFHDNKLKRIEHYHFPVELP
jgi:hypothetical protein